MASYPWTTTPAGQMARCPNCKHGVTIPDPGTQVLIRFATLATVEPAEPPTLQIKCIRCKALLQLKAEPILSGAA